MARARLLTHDAIARAAFELVDAAGSSALTINRLARALSVGPMTIYGYTPSKDEIVGLLPDVLLADLPALGENEPWPEQVVVCFTAIYARFVQHGEVTKLIATLPVTSERQRQLHEAIVALLQRARFSPAQALSIHRAASAYTLGAALLEINTQRSPTFRAASADEFAAGMRALLAGFGSP